MAADTTPPTGQVWINDHARAIAKLDVTLHIPAQDNSGSVTKAYVRNVFEDSRVGPWTEVEPYKSEIAWKLKCCSVIDTGHYYTTVEVKWEDASGNVSEPEKAEVQWFSGPPCGRIYADRFSNNFKVSVHADALEEEGIVAVRASSSPKVSNGKLVKAREWADRVYLDYHFTWDLSDPNYGGNDQTGDRTVYVQFKNAAGVYSSVLHATTHVDLIIPTKPGKIRTRLADDGQLDISNSTIQVTWYPSSDNDSRLRYEMQQSVDGGDWQQVSPSPQRDEYLDVLRDHTYHLRVRAVDSARNYSPWAYSSDFRLLSYQDNNQQIRYQGDWTRTAEVDAWDGYTEHASASHSTAAFTFYGKGIQWIAPKSPDSGNAKIWLDGQYIGQINLYSWSYIPRSIVFAYDWDDIGTHTIVIQPTSNKRVSVDGFVVIGSNTHPSVTPTVSVSAKTPTPVPTGTQGPVSTHVATTNTTATPTATYAPEPTGTTITPSVPNHLPNTGAAETAPFPSGSVIRWLLLLLAIGAASVFHRLRR